MREEEVLVHSEPRPPTRPPTEPLPLPDHGRPLEDSAPLRALALFRDLDDAGLEELRRRAVVRRFQEGENLVKAGSGWDALLVLRSGRVRVMHQRFGLGQQVIEEVGPGRPLTLIPALDLLPSPCTIVGITAGETFHVPGDSLRRLLEDHPRVALRMLRCMAMRLRSMTQLLGSLTMLTLEERLVNFLLRHAPIAGAAESPERRWDLNHEELGQRIGGSREEVTRLLSKLRRDGLLRIGRRHIEIVDPEALRQRAPEIPELTLL